MRVEVVDEGGATGLKEREWLVGVGMGIGGGGKFEGMLWGGWVVGIGLGKVLGLWGLCLGNPLRHE